MPTWVRGIEGGIDGIDAVAGEAIDAGELVTIDPADGLAYLACAADGTENVPALGICLESVAAGERGHFKTYGLVRDLPTCVDGYWYLSDTPGAFSATAGATSQVVAKMASGTLTMGQLDFANITHAHPVTS